MRILPCRTSPAGGAVLRTPPRILVVDDNPNNVDILKTRLESHGYEIVTAADGEAALIRAVEDAPDLILLDLMMPGVDGLEVCRRLSRTATYRSRRSSSSRRNPTRKT